MARRLLPLFAGLLLALLPLGVYWGAHRGYFEDDDLDTLSWVRDLQPLGLLREVFLPFELIPPGRPASFLFYKVLHAAFGLEYLPWAVVLQLLGCLNVILLWLLLRGLGFGWPSAAMGALFWIVGQPLFDAWWKPMFVHDVLCTTFSLACLLFYIQRRWIPSFLCLWLALRSKEIAVGLPVWLAAYEMLLGDRRWRRILPFAAPAILLGACGWWFIRSSGRGPYHVDAGLSALARSASFYAGRFFDPVLAALLIPLALIWNWRRPRFLFGAVAAAAALAIYLLLPDRLLPVYLYLASAALAVIVADLAERHPAVVAAFLALWLGVQWIEIRRSARETLEAAGDRRAFVEALAGIPSAEYYVCSAAPPSMHHWGVVGALHLLHAGARSVYRLEDPELPLDRPMTLIDWAPESRQLDASPFRPAELASLPRGRPAARWQIDPGWQTDESGWRSLDGLHTIRLVRTRPDQALRLELCGSSGQTLRVFAFYDEISPVAFDHTGCAWHTLAVPSRRTGLAPVDLSPGSPRLPVRVGGAAWE